MASVFFNIAKSEIAKALMDLDNDTLKVALIMTNHTLDLAGQEDVTNLAGLTLDEFDGAGYVGGHAGAGRKALAVSVVQDDANDRAEVQVTGGTTTWSALAPGTRQIEGALIFKEGASEAASQPIAWVPLPSLITPASPTGDVTINWSAQGAIQLT